MKKVYRICILAQYPLWTLPGLERLNNSNHYATWLEPLVQEFSKYHDFEIHWITMSKEIEFDCVHHHQRQTFHILARRSKAFQMFTGYLLEILKIRHTINEIKPDLLHAWGSEDVYGLAGAFSGISNRIFTLQGSLNDYLRRVGGHFLFRLQTCYERWTINQYKHGTAESPQARMLLLELNPNMHVDIVDYGVNKVFFDATWHPAVKPELLFIGTITNRKGIIDIIEVAKRSDLSNITFNIIGSGDLEYSLKKSASSNVKWLGRCQRDEVVRYLERSWALLIPTYADTGPTVLKEARVVGLPVITTSSAGASTYIESGKNGFVIEPGNLTELIQAIQYICRSRNEVIAAGMNLLDKQRKILHPHQTAESFIKIYRNYLQ